MNEDELTAAYQGRLLTANNGLLLRLGMLWLLLFDPDRPIITTTAIAGTAARWITGAQALAAAEAAAFLAALTAAAARVPFPQVAPFAIPPVAGTTAAGIPVADLAGLAPAVFWSRLTAGQEREQAAAGASSWLNGLARSEPYRAANQTVLLNATADDRLTGRVGRVLEAGACAFCVMIADRGYIPAHAGFRAHANCRCMASPELSKSVYTLRGMHRAAAAGMREATILSPLIPRI